MIEDIVLEFTDYDKKENNKSIIRMNFSNGLNITSDTNDKLSLRQLACSTAVAFIYMGILSSGYNPDVQYCLEKGINLYHDLTNPAELDIQDIQGDVC
mgnify:CR=1 FL=1